MDRCQVLSSVLKMSYSHVRHTALLNVATEKCPYLFFITVFTNRYALSTKHLQRNMDNSRHTARGALWSNLWCALFLVVRAAACALGNTKNSTQISHKARLSARDRIFVLDIFGICDYCCNGVFAGYSTIYPYVHRYRQ